jgi:hypothetical protein
MNKHIERATWENSIEHHNPRRSDYLSYLAIGAGLVALLTFLWYMGVVADALISLLDASSGA